jgi:hypothetical protein
MPHTQGKCIIGAKAQKVPNVPERIDLYWDGDSKGRSLGHRCQHGTAVLAVACPFCGTKEKDGQDRTQTTLLTMDGPSITESPPAKFQKIFPENSTWDSDACSVFALTHAQRGTLKENKSMGPKRGKFPHARYLLICSGMVRRSVI